MLERSWCFSALLPSSRGKSSVANDPSSSRGPRQGNGNVPIRGTRDGVDIEAIVNPGNNTVVTGYPTNVPHTPK